MPCLGDQGAAFFNSTTTTSLGVKRRMSFREVPSPLVMMRGMPWLLCFSVQDSTGGTG